MKKLSVILLICLSLLCPYARGGPAADRTQTPRDMATQDEFFMAQALELARLSVQHGNHPVGAVLVKDGQVVARAENTAITDNLVSHHDEINLIDKAWADLRVKSLEGYTLYVNVEPCFMCSGAIVISKVSTVVYGASQEFIESLVPGYRGMGITKIMSLVRQGPELRGLVLREAAEKILTDYVAAEEAKRARH